MSQWVISKGQAVDLQTWALEESGTKEFLDTLPELPKKSKIKPGLYVSYEIDEFTLDGGIDWPDVGVATVFAILENIWLSTADFDEVDDPQEWWRCVKDAYER